MYTCLIIDDELHAIEALKKYIEKTPQLTIVNYFTDPSVALQWILNSNPIDLVFLDVDMPEISGIELAKLIREKTSKLIFTTGHTKYAFEAFEVKADDYLLKPYSLAKFMSTVQNLFPNYQDQIFYNVQVIENEDFFFIKSKEDNHKLIKVRYDDIISIESKLNYILVLTGDRSILTYMSLTEMLNKLKKRIEFIQLHRSFILNTRYITSIEGNTINMENGTKMVIGDYYKKDFYNYINKRLFKAKLKH